MSTAKRSRPRQPDARSATSLPASKRLKTTKSSHVPAQTGLGFLVDEDARAGTKLEAKLTNGTSKSRSSRVDESHAVVAPDTGVAAEEGNSDIKPKEVIDISSEDESSEYEESDDEVEQPKRKATADEPLTNRDATRSSEDMNATSESEAEGAEDDEQAVASAEDVDMVDGGVVVDEPELEPLGEDGELEKPSFGDMLLARHPESIDLRARPESAARSKAIAPAFGDRGLAVPTGTSVGTVLTQALRTNDKDLLESCFQTPDVASVRSTIQRLHSQHVATLLQRLAERIYKRPGRTGNLMVWVQWSLICHGGYLATQPEVTRQLRSLARVIRERASGLQPLLHLKGKLDMLSAQLDMRKRTQASSRASNAEDDDDEEGVIYVEGQQDDDLFDDDAMEEEVDTDSKLLEPPKSHQKRQQPTPRTDESASEASDRDVAVPNGVAHHSEDGSDDAEEDEDSEDLLDIEADETSDDDNEEASSDEGESVAESASELEDESADEESDGPEVKQSKPNTLHRRR